MCVYIYNYIYDFFIYSLVIENESNFYYLSSHFLLSTRFQTCSSDLFRLRNLLETLEKMVEGKSPFSEQVVRQSNKKMVFCMAHLEITSEKSDLRARKLRRGESAALAQEMCSRGHEMSSLSMGLRGLPRRTRITCNGGIFKGRPQGFFTQKTD